MSRKDKSVELQVEKSIIATLACQQLDHDRHPCAGCYEVISIAVVLDWKSTLGSGSISQRLHELIIEVF